MSDMVFKRAERQPLGETYIYGDVLVKETLVPDAETVVPQHAHTYDHLSYLAAGAVEFYRGESFVGRYDAPCAFRIEARRKHGFFTLTDNVLILCIHNAAHGEAADIHEENNLVAED